MGTKAPAVDFVAAAATEFVEAVATEMVFGIHQAVEGWLAPIDRALSNQHLTTLGRLNAVQEVVEKYKRLTDKTQLKSAANRSGLIIERPDETS
jgi:hypothetical protein